MARRKAEFDIQANDRATGVLRRVAGETGKFERRLRGLKVAAGAALGVFAGGAALRGISRLTQEGLRSADSLGKQADRLGVAAKNLQAYRNAADLAGVSQQELEKGLARLNRSIGDVKNGLITESSPVFKAFERLGVTMEDLQSQSPEQVFERLVDKLGGINDTATQGALAMQLFGRSGQQLITLFNGGLAGIEESRKLLDDLGLSLDRIDAKKVENANDAMARLSQVADAAKQRLAVELAPAIEGVFTRLVEAGREGEDFGQRIEQGARAGITALDRLISGAQLAGGVFRLLWNSVTGLVSGLAGAITTAGGYIVDFFGVTAPEALNGLLEKTETGLTSMKQGFADMATSAANAVVGGMNTAIGAVEKMVNAVGDGLGAVSKAANAIDPRIPVVSFSRTFARSEGFSRFPVDRTSLGRLPVGDGSTGNAMRDVGQSYFDAFNTDSADAAKAIDTIKRASNDLVGGGELAKAFEDGQRAAGDFARAVAGSDAGGGAAGGSGSGGGGGGSAKSALEELRDAAKETGGAAGEALSAAADAGESVIGNLSSAIDEFVRTGKLNFADFARSVIADLAKIQLQKALLGSDGSGGVVGALVSGITSSFTGASYEGGGFTGSGARAGGVDGRGGFPAILHPDETVIDHRKGGGMGGPVTIQQTIEVRETLPEGIARDIVRKSQAAAVAAMQQINRRGGARREAFGLG